MVTPRQLFLQHVAQTSDAPLMLEIDAASGCEMTTVDGQKILDLISGIGVSNIGHCHPKVVEAVKVQSEKYMHLMVYGELVQTPQVALAKALTELLPQSLDMVYFVNSGAEAIEGAMKLVKRITGRTEIVSFQNAYHGSTQGALSLMGDEYFKTAFRPLLPGVKVLPYGDVEALNEISTGTAAVFAEMVQGEAGAVPPPTGYLKKLRARCNVTGTLLVADEIQTGFRRTGPFMAFMQEDIVPDVLVLAKGMGGGMPIGAFIASRDKMLSLADHPVLGHITTFGGHPVSCAAAMATLAVINSISETAIQRKAQLFREKLVHPAITNITGRGLMMGVEFSKDIDTRKLIAMCIEKGVLTDWFLFAPDKMRIAPPLIIEDHQIFMACDVILHALNELTQSHVPAG